MCKRFVYLISLVFLVALVSAGPAVAADPSLQLWLRLDGNADDSSNYARHGTENGTIAYVPGVFDQALELTQGDTAGGANEDYISVDWSGILGPNAFRRYRTVPSVTFNSLATLLTFPLCAT